MTDTTIAGDFTAMLDLPAAPEDLIALFTSPEGVSRWWGPTTGDGTIGGVLVISFGEHGQNAVRVLQTDPGRVVWEPVVADGLTPTGHTHEWLGTTIEVEVRAAGEGAQLHFRHRGLTPKLACWDDCVAGWNHFMASISSLLRTGSGHPYGS
jgi:uncharacterized protein YndB with AHSA1/START domain